MQHGMQLCADLGAGSQLDIFLTLHVILCACVQSYVMIGKLEEATKDLQQILTLEPGNAAATAQLNILRSKQREQVPPRLIAPSPERLPIGVPA